MTSSAATGAGPRVRVDDHHLLRVASRLTDRDHELIRLLYQHRVLTSSQVCDIAFSSVRRAEARLHALYQLRVVDRFRPQQWPGSAPYHWVLDQAGAAVIAAERGIEAKALPWCVFRRNPITRFGRIRTPISEFSNTLREGSAAA